MCVPSNEEEGEDKKNPWDVVTDVGKTVVNTTVDIVKKGAKETIKAVSGKEDDGLPKEPKTIDLQVTPSEPSPSPTAEPPKAPQLDPEQMAKIRAAGDAERRRALLRIGRTATKKTGSLGLPGDPFTATRKLLGG